MPKQELLNQLAHHNEHTRRDALLGLNQLLESHPSEAQKATGPLLEALSVRLSDGDASVRTALLALLRKTVLPALGPNALAPFLPILMAHASAALTNLSPEVRLDALGFLETLAEAASQLLLLNPEHLGMCLGSYASLLSRSHRGRSVKSQALSGLLRVLSSCDRFLTGLLEGGAGAGTAGGTAATGTAAAGTTAAVAAAGGGVSGGRVFPLMGFRCAGGGGAGKRAPSVGSLLDMYVGQPWKRQKTAAAGAGGKAGSGGGHKAPQQQKGGSSNSSSRAPTAAAGAAGGGGGSIGGTGGDAWGEQGLALLKALGGCWGECAPGSLGTAPEAESATALVHCLHCEVLLLGALGAGHVSGAAGGFEGLGRSLNLSYTAAAAGGFDQGSAAVQCAVKLLVPQVTGVFPVRVPQVAVEETLVQLLGRFNLLAVQLLSGLMVAGGNGGGSYGGGGGGWQGQLLQSIAGRWGKGNVGGEGET